MKSLIVGVFLTVALALSLPGCFSAPKKHAYNFGEYANSTAESAFYLGALKESGTLPGVRKDEHGEVKIVASLKGGPSDTLTFSYPLQLEATFVKETENEFIYRYFITKQDYDTPCMLVKVFKEDKTGKVIDDDFTIPSERIQNDIYHSLKKNSN